MSYMSGIHSTAPKSGPGSCRLRRRSHLPHEFLHFGFHSIRDRSVNDYTSSQELERDASPTGDGSDDEERFRSRDNGLGQWGVRRFVGKVLTTGEETQERPTCLRDVVTDRAAQHRVPALERVND